MRSLVHSERRNEKNEITLAETTDEGIEALFSLKNTENNKNLPVIRISLINEENENMQSANSLIDTGSTISLMSDDLFQEIIKYQKVERIARTVKITTFTGSEINFITCAVIKIKIGNQIGKQKFFITKDKFPEEYKIILGYDAIKNLGITIEINKNEIKTESETIKLETYKSHSKQNNINESCCNNIKLFNKSKQTLDSGETKVITLFAKTTINKNQGLFIPKKLKQCVEINDAIVSTKNSEIMVIAKNVSENATTLNKHMMLGEIQLDIEIFDLENKNGECEIDNYKVNLINVTPEIREQRLKEFDLNNFNLMHLNSTDKKRTEQVLQEYFEVFSSSLKTLGHTDAIKPKIELLNDDAVAQKPYKIPFALQPELKKQLQELLDNDIIRKTESNYAAPVLLVKKRSQDNEVKYRMAIDLRMINEFIELNPIPLPRISELVTKLAGYKYYSTLDLTNAFWQLNMPEEQRHLLAFTTIFGNYEFNRLCFGLKNSTAYFQRLMDEVLCDMGEQILWYVDDIVVMANSIEEMNEKLVEVFERLRKFNLTLSPNKCKLFQNKITFLGFEISEQGISPNEENTNKIMTFPKPKTLRQLKKFLGICNFYRSLIPNCAKIVDCLEKLTCKGMKFKWNTQCDEAFNQIREIFINKPFVIQPNLNETFYLNTDCSSKFLSGILCQKVDGKLRPIKFFSRRLKNTQQKYAATKLELLAIIESVRYFKDYLYGKQFIILSDHMPLKYHLKLSNPAPMIARWLIELSEYSFQFEHIQGVNNWFADYLSRVDTENEKMLNTIVVDRENKNVTRQKSKTMLNVDLSIENILHESNHDREIQKLLNDIKENKLNGKQKSDRFYIDNDTGLLMHLGKWPSRVNNDELIKQIVLPTNLRKHAIKKMHITHLGIDKTYLLTTEKYWWPQIYADVRNYVLSCDACCKVKPSHQTKIQYGEAFIPKKVNQIISIDICGQFRNGKYILSLIDQFSRRIELFIINNIKTSTIVDKIIWYMNTFGKIDQIVSDRGKQFVSQIYEEINRRLNIRIMRTLPYNPKANGLIERIHSSLKNTIYTLDIEGVDFNLAVQLHKSIYNGTKHETTKFAPNELFFGRAVKLIIDEWDKSEHTAEQLDYNAYYNKLKETFDWVNKQARKNMIQARDIRDKKREKVSVKRELHIGDLVYLENNSKFRNKFVGPFKIISTPTKNTAEIKSLDKYFPSIKKVSVSRLKKCEDRRPHLV